MSMYIEGMTNKVKAVPTDMPPTSTKPMELRAAAPAPLTSTNGKYPAMVALLVIRMGRRRVWAASRIASRLLNPFN